MNAKDSIDKGILTIHRPGWRMKSWSSSQSNDQGIRFKIVHPNPPQAYASTGINIICFTCLCFSLEYNIAYPLVLPYQFISKFKLILCVLLRNIIIILPNAFKIIKCNVE